MAKTEHEKRMERLTRLAILERAMDPGGADAWAKIDRKIPGESYGRVIIPQPRPDDGYSPSALPVTEQTVADAIWKLQSGITLEELGCSEEFVDQVDAVLNASHTTIFNFEPAVAARIVQIGLFGSVWYP